VYRWSRAFACGSAHEAEGMYIITMADGLVHYLLLFYNTVENPHRVRLEKVVIRVSDGFAYRFPSHSVTAIVLNRK
jgi:hypothetical protein